MTGPSYDFNTTYQPLRVYNQLNEGACVDHARGLAAVAAVLMQTGEQIGWVDDGRSYPQFQFVADGADWDNAGWVAQIGGQTHRLIESNPTRAAFDWVDKAVVGPFLDRAGTLGLGLVPMPSYGQPRDCSTLPVIRPIPFDDDPAVGSIDGGQLPGHRVLAVGYTDDGLIIQNSWGLSYGCQGRVVLAWEWLDRWSTDVSFNRVDTYPIEAMTRTPQPLRSLKRHRMLLAQRTPNSPVWAVTGGIRSWIRKWAVLTPQGYGPDDVKVIPASDPMWALAAVQGPMPPGGDR